jgi:multidrug efflux pump subunit AcrB
VAIREAVQEIIWPVTTSTITTVVVFLPLGLLTGVEGQFFQALSITLTIAVLVSLVLALALIPLLSEQYLTAADAEEGETVKRTGLLARIGRRIDALSMRYERSLGASLHHTRWMIATALLLVGAGVVAYKFVGTGFLPEMDEGAFVLDYVTPGGTALAETDRMLKVVEDTLAKTPEVVGTSRRTGAEMGLFATEQNTGDIVVRLKAEGDRDRDILEVIDDVRTKVETAVPRMRIEFVQILSDVLNDLAGVENPVEVKLFGPDLTGLEAYGTALAEKLEKVDGLEDVYNGVSEPSAELAMTINGAEANRVGLTPEQVSSAVSGA